MTEQIKKEDEIVIVVNRKKLFKNEELTFQGHTSDPELVDKIMYHMDMYYKTMRRGSREEVNVPVSKNAELNFDYKQPIPYIIIKRGDQFYATQRLAGGGESRLHGQISMGAGGHMNALSASEIESINKVIQVNTERELEEELDIQGKYTLKTIGLINDDSEEVSRVHIGVLGFLELEESGEVTVKETEQLAGKWCTLEQLRTPATYDRLENWGKIVVDMLG
jgi:predicted NUDIX family phosphoesterase